MRHNKAAGPGMAADRPIHFFYWCDRPSSKLDELLESAEHQGIRAHPIGEGTFKPRFHFSLFKQAALYRAVRQLDEQDIVCATDGFDVFYQRDAAAIRHAFEQYDADVVFAAERGYSHQWARYKAFFDVHSLDSPYRYLNAGGVIGYAGALRKLYEPTWRLRLKLAIFRRRPIAKLAELPWRAARRFGLGAWGDRAPHVQYITPHRYSDQAQMGRSMARGHHGLRYALDRHARLFWCAAFEWDDLENHYSLRHGLVRNRHTGTAPAIIHVPWGLKRPLFEQLYRNYVNARDRLTAHG